MSARPPPAAEPESCVVRSRPRARCRCRPHRGRQRTRRARIDIGRVHALHSRPKTIRKFSGRSTGGHGLHDRRWLWLVLIGDNRQDLGTATCAERRLRFCLRSRDTRAASATPRCAVRAGGHHREASDGRGAVDLRPPRRHTPRARRPAWIRSKCAQRSASVLCGRPPLLGFSGLSNNPRGIRRVLPRPPANLLRTPDTLRRIAPPCNG
jgi:hypothetical protein